MCVCVCVWSAKQQVIVNLNTKIWNVRLLTAKECDSLGRGARVRNHTFHLSKIPHSRARVGRSGGAIALSCSPRPLVLLLNKRNTTMPRREKTLTLLSQSYPFARLDSRGESLPRARRLICRSTPSRARWVCHPYVMRQCRLL